MSPFSNLYDIKPFLNLAYDYAKNWYFEGPYTLPNADLKLVKVLAATIQGLGIDKPTNICHSFGYTHGCSSKHNYSSTNTIYAIELDGVWFYEGNWLDQKGFERYVVAQRETGMARDYVCKHHFVAWFPKEEQEFDMELYTLIQEGIKNDEECQSVLQKIQLSQSTVSSQRIGFKSRL